MRIISVLLLVLALAACQGGDRMAKAASVPQSSPGPQSAVIEGDGAQGGATCMDKCSARADDKQAKCLKAGTAAVCSEAHLEDTLQCANACALR